MVTCSHQNFGCDGGYLSATIDYLENYGVTTADCKAYKSGGGINGICKYWCDDLTTEYKKYYCKRNSLMLITEKTEVMDELMENGPL